MKFQIGDLVEIKNKTDLFNMALYETTEGVYEVIRTDYGTSASCVVLSGPTRKWKAGIPWFYPEELRLVDSSDVVE